MDILVLGGTVFLGRHLVELTLARGDGVTIVHRGIHGHDLFPEVERLVGDRDAPSGIAALADAVASGRRWDAVVDCSGYVPRVVRHAAELLREAAGRYCFVSSVSVYADLAHPGATESAPVGTLDDPTVETVTGESYGPLKALCEAVVTEVFGDRALVVRPGLIVGPDDPSARFAYWPLRLARGGEVLAPGPPDGFTQFVDVRDLAAFILDTISAGRAGTFHVTSEPLPFESVVEAGLAAASARGCPPAGVTWVDADFLLAREVAPWSGLPLWLPDEAGMPGFLRVDVSAAMAAGLRIRPVVDTMADTLAWALANPDVALPAGAPVLTAEREIEVLQEWHRR